MIQVDSSLRQRIFFVTWTLPSALILLSVLHHSDLTDWTSGGCSTSVAQRAGLLIFTLVGPLMVFGILKLISRWLDSQLQTATQVQSRATHLGSIVVSAADAIVSMDLRGIIESWNLGAELLFGYEPAQVCGRPLSVLFGRGPAGRVESEWLIATVKREHLVRRHETICQDASGRKIVAELAATLLSNDGAKPTGISIILRDTTNRKRWEEETRRLNVSLSRQAAEKEHELTDKVDQLAQANVELKQLDQMRSEFVSLVSHQIRAPLTNMFGAVQHIQRDCAAMNPTCTRMFTIFEQQIARLDRLVQDVLNATRIESGEMVFHLEPISVLPIVQQTVQQVEARTRRRPVQIADKPGLPLIYADRDRVVEVLSNLLDNADKYSPPGEPLFVEIRADQSEVTITVRDSGPGVPLDDIDRLFDKFYRADSGDAQTVYGYGLGLYVCRQLVEAQGGQIWAENHPDGGAIFSFSLPVWER